VHVPVDGYKEDRPPEPRAWLRGAVALGRPGGDDPGPRRRQLGAALAVRDGGSQRLGELGETIPCVFVHESVLDVDGGRTTTAVIAG
jgi:hypothetical protein